jgi:hypothetical protein
MANRSEVQGSGRNRGVSRVIRANKRAEAEERNARTPIERTKAYRTGRTTFKAVETPEGISIRQVKIDAPTTPKEKRDVQTKGRSRRNRKADEELLLIQEVNAELLKAEL